MILAGNTVCSLNFIFNKSRKITNYIISTFISGRHYYWDWSSDLVAWLPPDHPKCQISQPASQLREELHLKATEQDDNTSSEESGSEHEPEEVFLNYIYFSFSFF